MNKEQRQVLSVSEVKAIQDLKADAEDRLKAAGEGWGTGTARSSVDTEGIKREIQQYDGALKRGAAPKTTGRQRDALVNEAKELEAVIKEGMPTRRMMEKPEDYGEMATINLRWQRRTAPAVARWKQIQRTLDPNNPDAAYLERLRRAR